MYNINIICSRHAVGPYHRYRHPGLSRKRPNSTTHLLVLTIVLTLSLTLVRAAVVIVALVVALDRAIAVHRVLLRKSQPLAQVAVCCRSRGGRVSERGVAAPTASILIVDLASRLVVWLPVAVEHALGLEDSHCGHCIVTRPTRPIIPRRAHHAFLGISRGDSEAFPNDVSVLVVRSMAVPLVSTLQNQMLRRGVVADRGDPSKPNGRHRTHATCPTRSRSRSQAPRPTGTSSDRARSQAPRSTGTSSDRVRSQPPRPKGTSDARTLALALTTQARSCSRSQAPRSTGTSSDRARSQPPRPKGTSSDAGTLALALAHWHLHAGRRRPPLRHCHCQRSAAHRRRRMPRHAGTTVVHGRRRGRSQVLSLTGTASHRCSRRLPTPVHLGVGRPFPNVLKRSGRTKW